MKFRSCTTTRTPLGRERELLFDRTANRVMVAPTTVAAALSHCGTFATLQDHAARIYEITRGELSVTEWERHLANAADHGFMLSLEDATRRVVNGFTTAASPRTIECIAIPTKGRPHQLARLLEDLRVQLANTGRDTEVLIIDDSDEESEKATSEVVGRYRSSGLDVRYGNRRSRTTYAERLAEESGVPAEIAKFALLGDAASAVTTGAARNSLLLDSVDRSAILFLDDDVLCRLVKVPSSSDGLTFAKRYTGRFLMGAEDVDAHQTTGEDVIAIHEKVLNIDRTLLAGAVARGEVDITAATDALLTHLDGGSASVRVSLTGLLGDAGIGDPLQYYIQGLDTFAQLTSSRDLYRAALTNRMILRGPRGTLLAERAECMTYCMGVVVGDFVPPFSPVMRAQECLFEVLMARCVRGALFGAAPRAIVHLPIPRRTFAPGAAVKRAGGLMVGEMLARLAHAAVARGETAQQRLVVIGRSLQDLAHRDDDFREAVRRAALPVVVHQLRSLEEILERFGDSHYWGNDVRQLRDACLRKVDDGSPVPLELESAGGGTEAFRGILLRLSRALQDWPTLLDAARRLRTQGVRVCN